MRYWQRERSSGKASDMIDVIVAVYGISAVALLVIYFLVNRQQSFLSVPLAVGTMTSDR